MDQAAAPWVITDRELQEIRRSLAELGSTCRATALSARIICLRLKSALRSYEQTEYHGRNMDLWRCEMSEMALMLPKETMRALTELTGEARSDAALTLMIRDYVRYKLAEIDAALRRFEEKYGMPFDAYRRIWETEDREEHYTYEAEQDYLEWEALITRRKRLVEGFAWLP